MCRKKPRVAEHQMRFARLCRPWVRFGFYSKSYGKPLKVCFDETWGCGSLQWQSVTKVFVWGGVGNAHRVLVRGFVFTL
jgi:hypothetical protein